MGKDAEGGEVKDGAEEGQEENGEGEGKGDTTMGARQEDGGQ